MTTELYTGSDGDAARGRMAELLLRRDDWLPRFAYYYRKIAALPRPWRRQLRRKLAVTVTGAALLLALAGPLGPPVLAAPDATINVVNGEVAIVQNNKCSLMEAIINARATTNGQMKADCTSGNSNGPDTVSLPANGAFVLTAPHNSQFGPTGLPVITSDMTINGNGSTIRRSDVTGTPRFRILAVDPNVSLTLRDMTISNGYIYDEYGGGIYSKGTLTVEGSTITGNQASGGAGIFASQATIVGSTISDNTVGGWDYAEGGGISAWSLIVENSVISGNDGGDGGGIWAYEATISGSRIVDNEADESYGAAGGGIRARNLTLSDSTVAGNIAWGGEDYGGSGGGVSAYSGTISGSTISGNRAVVGWDSYNYGVPVSGLGGGVFASGPLTIVNSTISNNEANYGGGLHVYGNETTLVHSTLSGNNARLDTDGWNGYEETVGGKGGGVFVHGWSSCGTLTARGNLVSGNTAEDQGREVYLGQGFDCSTTINANASNVFGRNGNSGLVGFTPGATDVVPTVGLSAILSPLADNGGPTMTHALPTGSPALDLAPNNSCTAAPVNGVDQRGEPRNANGSGGNSANECDAGSFELQPGGGGGAFLVSPASTGSINGLAFTPSDILKFDPSSGWSLYFDGSDVGISKNLSAFEVFDNGHILMSFATNQAIPGVGTFMPQDIARFVPTTTGPNTNGSFQWQLDGSTVGLTTSGEKIDALAENGDGRIAISTTGAAVVMRPEGGKLKAQDEDALGYNFDLQRWSALFDGTAVPGLGVEDVNGLWIDPATGDVYVSILGAFNLGGISGNGRDIVKLTANGAGGYTPSLWWDGSEAGFPVNIDGVEILP